jgi:hypothetical protein
MSAMYADPANRYLPENEEWRPQTWVSFRYAVLRRLKECGAHSVEELASAPPELLYLELNRNEILAALDSARRRGLVRTIDPRSGGGAIASREEWVLTEDGRRTIRHGIPWILDKLAVLPKLVSIGTFLGALGLSAVISQQLRTSNSSEIIGLVELLVVLGGALCFMTLTIRARSAGARVRRNVCRDWRRWQADKPHWYAIARRRFPWKWLPLAFLGFLLGVLAAGYLPIGSFPAGMLLLAVAWLFAAPIYAWSTRWDLIAGDAIAQQRIRRGQRPRRGSLWGA